jgi:hypothetical protein
MATGPTHYVNVYAAMNTHLFWLVLNTDLQEVVGA